MVWSFKCWVGLQYSYEKVELDFSLSSPPCISQQLLRRKLFLLLVFLSKEKTNFSDTFFIPSLKIFPTPPHSLSHTHTHTHSLSHTHTHTHTENSGYVRAISECHIKASVLPLPPSFILSPFPPTHGKVETCDTAITLKKTTILIEGKDGS